MIIWIIYVIMKMIPIDTLKLIMNIHKNQLYTTQEVAKILKVSAVTIKRYISGNKILSIKFNGLRRIKGNEILNIINSNNRNYGRINKKTEKSLYVPNKK